jgi:hypothetical protein
MSDAKARRNMRSLRVFMALATSLGLLTVSVYWLIAAKKPHDSLGPAEQALFPLPRGSVISGLPDRRDTCLELHTLSRPLLQTDAEKALEFSDFDPLATPSLVMKQGMLPSDLASRFQKKLRWWPHMEMRKIVERANVDTCGVRFTWGGYTFQLLENRVCFMLIARRELGDLDLSKSAVCDAVPQCYMDFVNPALFVGATPVSTDSASFSGGVTLYCCDILLAKAMTYPENGVAKSVSLYWSEKTATLSISRGYVVATPSLIVGKPIVKPPRGSK